MDITGNTVFVPGATSGIGLALALRLQQEGNTVVIGGRRTALLDQLTAEHPGLPAVPIDTADPTSIQRAAAQVVGAPPDLQVLATLAGLIRRQDSPTPDAVLTCVT